MKRFFGLPWAAVVAIAVFLALLGATQLPGEAAFTASAAAVSQQIGMKVLLITDNTNEPSYQDWENTLNREGVPFDSVVTTPATGEPTPGGANTFSTLPTLSSTASDGTQVANYEGVVVAISGTVGMTTDQWSTLQTFEHQFSVRQLTAYAAPSSDYGMNAPNPAGGATLAPSTALTLTADGSSVFPYLKQVAVDPTQSTWAYQATPLAGANVDTLISAPGGITLLGIYTSSDGRQTMFQTFNENQYYLQSQLLRHGELDWLTRNTYFGDQRNYLETDVDDNFLSDDTWDTATHATDFTPADALREVPADVTTAATWSKQNNFRIDMLFNGGGSVAFANGCTEDVGGDGGAGGTTTGCNTSAPGTDPLLAQFQATDPATGKPYTDDFGWISHTWDHPNIDEGCATQDYIEAELNQNTTWASTAAASGNPTTGGLGLTSSTNPADAFGSENPNVIITGEHSGIANLLPGNPGQVDPPALDEATPATTGGTLAAGEYVYAVTDQFNTAAPGATPVPGTGQSAASMSAPVTVTGTTGSVALTWGAVCHAAQYTVYRAPYTAPVAPATTGTIGAWSLLGTVQANTSTDFTNPTGNSTTTTAGGGAIEKTFTDTGAAGTATGSSGDPTATSIPADVGAADESPYEQNPVLDAAFAATEDGGIKYFGSDASKPYPNPADGSFATGTYSGAEYAPGATFQDAGATAIPRYPTNIYYNVSTNAQEVDEYETLYDAPTCVPITNVTTCNPAGTAFTIGQIVASVDQGMFGHMMGNDPRPHYFHQTNLMDQSGQGDGLFYETVNPLLTEYNTYFASNAPIVQLTMPQIGTLLTEQSGWGAANKSQISGYIEGNVVTVNNSGAATEIPLTGTNIGTPYAGTQSGWTSAPSGASTYTALAAWPALPTAPVTVTTPTGPAPSGPPATGGKPINQVPPTAPSAPPAPTQAKAPLYYVAVQVAPKTVSIKNGKAIVSLKCEAKNGKPAKNHFCTGKFTLKVMGKTVTDTFRIKATKIARITVTLPKAAMAAAAKGRHRTLHGMLAISTKQPTGAAKLTRGTLNIKT